MSLSKFLLLTLGKTGRCGLLLVFLCTADVGFARPIEQAVESAARYFESVRNHPPALREFLWRMPKGADLHSHLSGAVYAETYLDNAVEDRLCVNLTSFALFDPEPLSQADKTRQPVCPQHSRPAAVVLNDQNLYDAVVNALSMRSFAAGNGVSGHDHFFASFAKFDAVSSTHLGEWLLEVANRAARQNEQYLELMQSGNFDHTKEIAQKIGWLHDFTAQRNALLGMGLRDDIAVYSRNLDHGEQRLQQLARCGGALAEPACQVEIRYLYQILRGYPKAEVFAQALLGFEIASQDPRVVGINLVMPEDGRIALQDYSLHMRMIGFLHNIYPKVHISLHAGELSFGQVPPDRLCCHVREAVQIAHAERIGHGVDVLYEHQPYALLKELADKHVLIETNLTSNAVILGIDYPNHPFPVERRFAVPVALSTDDEGVSRIDLTHEFVRAASTYRLSYADLKQMVRAGLEHSFLPGVSLWDQADRFDAPVAACARDRLGGDTPSPDCALLLKTSEKARQQWLLEQRFRQFETEVAVQAIGNLSRLSIGHAPINTAKPGS